jgi:hypothetical protein
MTQYGKLSAERLDARIRDASPQRIQLSSQVSTKQCVEVAGRLIQDIRGYQEEGWLLASVRIISGTGARRRYLNIKLLDRISLSIFTS